METVVLESKILTFYLSVYAAMVTQRWLRAPIETGDVTRLNVTECL
jgi:hypothetical protein